MEDRKLPSNIDSMAKAVSDMWSQFITQKFDALELNKEVRSYLYGTDNIRTSSNTGRFANNTNLPILSSVGKTLKSKIWTATLSRDDFFVFESDGLDPADVQRGKKLVALLKAKLEKKRFRTTTGRDLVRNFVDYGNAFIQTEYVREVNDDGDTTFKGPVASRIEPSRIVFDPLAPDFKSSPKIVRMFVHLGDVMDMPLKFPNATFDEAALKEVADTRASVDFRDAIATDLMEFGISVDGFGDIGQYLSQHLVEILVYRGSLFDPATNEVQRDRLVYVADRRKIIRNDPLPIGAAGGLHHSAAILRPDNLWAMGPLDTSVGMQYRINTIENAKADAFEFSVQPIQLVIGDNAELDDEPLRPGQRIHLGSEEDMRFITPPSAVLQADSEIATYKALMEDEAGVPPETRGIRTPGEKSAFEVGQLREAADEQFLDLALNFARGLETMLDDMRADLIQNFDEADGDEVGLLDDITNQISIERITRSDLEVAGSFRAIGPSHWQQRRRKLQDLVQFGNIILNNPVLAAHVSTFKFVTTLSELSGVSEHGLVEEFIGAKESVEIPLVAQDHQAQFQASGAGEVAEEAQEQSATTIDEVGIPGAPASSPRSI